MSKKITSEQMKGLYKASCELVVLERKFEHIEVNTTDERFTSTVYEIEQLLTQAIQLAKEVCEKTHRTLDYSGLDGQTVHILAGGNFAKPVDEILNQIFFDNHLNQAAKDFKAKEALREEYANY